MKPWQTTCLVAITVGVATWYVGTLIRNNFIFALGMAAAVAVIAVKVMQPRDKE